MLNFRFNSSERKMNIDRYNVFEYSATENENEKPSTATKESAKNPEIIAALPKYHKFTRDHADCDNNVATSNESDKFVNHQKSDDAAYFSSS